MLSYFRNSLLKGLSLNSIHSKTCFYLNYWVIKFLTTLCNTLEPSPEHICFNFFYVLFFLFIISYVHKLWLSKYIPQPVERHGGGVNESSSLIQSMEETSFHLFDNYYTPNEDNNKVFKKSNFSFFNETRG